MKVQPPLQPALRSTPGNEFVGRSGRRAVGDLSSSKGNAAPVKAFQGALNNSKSALVQPSSAQIGTTLNRSSNASILQAIGARTANFSSPRQASATDGAGRTPSNPPRGTNPPPTNTGDTPTNPTTPAPPSAPNAPIKFNSLQQNWLDANTGAYANIMKANLERAQPFQIDGVDIRWANGSTGKPEFSQRAVGNVSDSSGRELAQLFGGTLVKSPFDTFGTSQRDQYIRMPNGQMIEASVLASQLNAARTAADPFSATQSVLEIYKGEIDRFDMAKSTNAIDMVSKGMLIAGTPSNRMT